jgi:hypothetical protein
MFPATILLLALAATLAAPAAAQEPEGEPEDVLLEIGTGEAPRKEIIIKKTAPETGPCGPLFGEAVVLPVFGMLVPITFFAGIAAVIIVAIIMAHRATQMRYDVIQLAIKEGKDLPPDILRNGRRDPLLTGLILTALGIALSIALGAVAGWVQGVWGLIPLFVGVAFLVYVPHWRKQKKEDEAKQ